MNIPLHSQDPLQLTMSFKPIELEAISLYDANDD